MIESYKLRRGLAAGALSLAGALALTGCSESYNYEGVGNHFKVRGIVSDVEADGTVHVGEQQLVVEQAEGDAVDWFTHGYGQNFNSDKYNFEKFFNQRQGDFWSTTCEVPVETGHVYGIEDEPISEQQLVPGEVVEIEGAIRDSDVKGKGCHDQQWAVFDTIRVVQLSGVR